MPSQVAFFLESERGRMVAEFDGCQTTDHNRLLLDASIEGLRMALHSYEEQPTPEASKQVLVNDLFGLSAFVLNTLQQTMPDVSDFLVNGLPMDRQERQAFVEKSAALGGLLHYGCALEKWRQRHQDTKLSSNDIAALSVSQQLAKGDLGMRGTKRLANILARVSIV